MNALKNKLNELIPRDEKKTRADLEENEEKLLIENKRLSAEVIKLLEAKVEALNRDNEDLLNRIRALKAT